MSFCSIPLSDHPIGYLIDKDLFFYKTVYEEVANPDYQKPSIRFSCEHYQTYHTAKHHKFCPECGILLAAHKIGGTPEKVWVEKQQLRESFGDTTVKEMLKTRLVSLHGEEFEILPLISLKGNRFAKVGDYDGHCGFYQTGNVDSIFLKANNRRYFTEWDREAFRKVAIPKAAWLEKK